MGSIVSAITGTGGGSSSGSAGVNYQAAPANLQTPTTNQQAQDAYTAAQAQLSNQNAFLAATQAQNGLGNQANVFSQLQGVASGTGPNPAQAQLAQATGANVANQAALMAGQRGSSQNVGLIARQAAQQGAQTQQQSAGQAATLQAQQSLNALQGLGGLATTQVTQQANATNAANQAAQNEQQNILSAIAAQNSAQVGQTSSMNAANASIANTVAGGQMQLVGNLAGGLGAAAGLAKGGEVQRYADGAAPVQAPSQAVYDPNLVAGADQKGPRSNIGQYFNTGNTPQQNANQGMATAGNSIGKGIGLGLKAGYKSMFGSNSDSDTSNDDTPIAYGSSGQLPGSDYLNVEGDTTPPPDTVTTAGGAADLSDTGELLSAKGGRVPALLSPGERYLNPRQVEKVIKKGANPMKEGKLVPGKAPIPGAKDSYSNDIVPAMPEEGGFVIPRHITQSKDAEKKAIAFVKAHMASSLRNK